MNAVRMLTLLTVCWLVAVLFSACQGCGTIIHRPVIVLNDEPRDEAGERADTAPFILEAQSSTWWQRLQAWYCKQRTGGAHRWANQKQSGNSITESCKYCGETRTRVLPTPEPAPQPKPDVEPTDDDGEKGDLPPRPAATHAPQWDTAGATAAALGGGSHWKPTTSKGRPKLVLKASLLGKVAHVTVWGPGGYRAQPERWGSFEEGGRERYYIPGAVPSSVTIRLHIPGGQDIFFTVPDTSKRVG